MKLTLLIVAMSAFSLFAQITITGEDVETIFEIGNSTTIKQDTLASSVDIGNLGGNNVWDFTSLQYNLQGDYTSVDPASTLFFPYFPDATFCMHLEDFSQGFKADTWTYASLNGFFNNFGGALTSSNFPGDFILTLNDPPKETYINPMTYNSQWSQTYTQTIYFNGTLLNSADATLNVIVDAYGTMTLPGGESYEALRLRETLTIDNLTSVTYSFLSKDGAQVALYAASSNPPSSGVISVSGTSFNSELNSGGTAFVITQPEESEIIIAGEVDTIAYENYSGNVDLFYRTDYGLEYVLIDTSYSDPDGIYLWDVPDSLLTTRATIRIVESEDTNSVALSEEFKIKPWWLTRTDANGDFELYELDQDGWSFSNTSANQWPMTWWTQFNYSGTDPITGNSYPNQSPFNNAPSSSFPDWPLFVEVFSESACYNGLSYRTAATTRWGNLIGQWGGSCFGFAVTSLLGYYRQSTLEGMIGNFNDLIEVGINNDSRLAINHFQIIQYSQEVRNYRLQRTNKTARDLLADLKEMFGKDNVDASPLRYPNTNGSGGHAVVPYRLERVDNSSNFNIWVYNPNNPNDFTQFIYIDSVANTWNDSTSLNFGSATTDCYLHNESAFFLDTLTLRPMFGNNSSYQENSSSLSRLTILNTTEAEIVITSGNGEQIGYQDSTAFNNMSDAIPLIPETGYFHPPTGYYLPENSYLISMDNFSSPNTTILFQSEMTIYSYLRNDAQPDDNDLLGFSTNGIKLINPDDNQKNIEFSTVILDENMFEKVFTINSIAFASGDSLNFQQLAGNELLFNNYGQNNLYNLRLVDLSQNGEFIFEHNALQIDENSGHQLVPDWENLTNSELTILIDEGNDGTIDDTIFVKNQATNVEDEGSLLSPNSYNLTQNYPNPFNPTTTIKYSIPQSGNVTLKVYDILGNEVVTLLNEEKNAGVFSVTFDATGLSSGIYFYRMQAGNFIQTRKMLILK